MTYIVNSSTGHDELGENLIEIGDNFAHYAPIVWKHSRATAEKIQTAQPNAQPLVFLYCDKHAMHLKFKLMKFKLKICTMLSYKKWTKSISQRSQLKQLQV